MIVAHNLTFAYKSKQLLFRGISFELPQGSIVGLLGRNGEGKSTLMKLLTGRLIAKSGTLLSGDINIGKRDYQYLQNVYMLPEDMSAPHMSVKTYFDIVSSFYPTYDAHVAQEIAEAFEVDWSWNLAKISMGQRKKCLISLALALRTPLLLLDEPTNGLDIPSKGVFRRLLAKYSTDSQTIVISTHQVRDLEQLIDHIIMLDNNQIVCNKSIAEITERLVFAPVTSQTRNLAFYREPIMAGEYGVWSRRPEDDDEGNFSMELFFNAMIACRTQMHEILLDKQ